MLIGAHVSAAGGLFNAPQNAKAMGCETFQFFTRSPQGGPTSVLTPESIKAFRDACEANGFDQYATHAPYFINFASSETRIRKGSINVIRQELERGSALGVTHLMAHLGSAKDVGDEKEARKIVIKGLQEVLDGYKGSTRFLIEISAGAGMVIGDTFEEIAELIDAVKVPKGRDGIGVCFDTQHAFASGYDLRTKEAVAKTVKQLDAAIGIERVVMSHCNDSKCDFNAKKDRHEHIGEGKIGAEGFRAIVNHPKLKHWLLMLETPWDGKEKDDLALLKKMRGKA